MKQKRHTTEEIIWILREADGGTTTTSSAPTAPSAIAHQTGPDATPKPLAARALRAPFAKGLT